MIKPTTANAHLPERYRSDHEAETTVPIDPLAQVLNPDAIITKEELDFIEAMIWTQQKVHLNAVEKGFWKDSQNPGEKIALMHAELSEALEHLRNGEANDDKLPLMDGCLVELADVVIRAMDFCEQRGRDKKELGLAIVLKMRYNASREPMHGKKF